MAYRASMLARSLCLPAQRGICNALGMANSSLLTNLVAYYKFADANDSHTGGLNLTEVNSPTYTTGRVGNCVNLVRASSQYLSRNPNPVAGSPTSIYTIMGLVRFASLPGVDSLPLVSNIQAQFEIGYSAAYGTFRVTLRDAAGSFYGFGGFTPIINTWYHVALIIDVANTSKFYVDGNLIDTHAALPGGLLVSAQPLLFGTNYLSHYLDGRLDEWGIWDAALTQTQRDNIRVAQAAGGGSYPFVGIP